MVKSSLPSLLVFPLSSRFSAAGPCGTRPLWGRSSVVAVQAGTQNGFSALPSFFLMKRALSHSIGAHKP